MTFLNYISSYYELKNATFETTKLWMSDLDT